MDTRNRLSMAEWEKLFAEQQQSGLIVSHFCQGRGITAGSFRSALKRKKTLLAQPELEAKSVVHGDDSVPRNHSAHRSPVSSSSFVALSVREDTARESSMDRSEIRVRLRSGHQLHIDADHLRRLIHVLESAS